VSNLLKREKGFTLIEIVLVMAIAGLILVIVFLALQGAQKSRRDNARKHDAARMLSAVESCASNNNGKYVNCTGALVISGGYFSPNVTPDGGTYTAAGATTSSFLVNTGTNITCPTGDTTTTHSVTVSVGVESGPNYCVGN
jgi:prepilin-type N-terminal cleavage/methylation domain-containing protein